LTAGTYTVKVTDANGCTKSQKVTVVSPAALVLTAVANNVNCTYDTLASASASITGGVSPYTYSWSNGATSASITGITSGTYTVMVTDANGCTKLQVINVTINTKPKASVSATPTSGMVPLSVVFTNNSTGGSSYSWIFGDGNTSNTKSTTNTYTNVGTYTVMMIVTASNGCKDTAYITVIADGLSTIVVPNVFSPNTDGVNDVFIINSFGLTDLQVDIYDRWGLKMGGFNTITGGWDGKAQSGKDAPEGTYYYILKAHGVDSKEYNLKGYLMLLRK
jgi:gliding motility-associated-like protein